MKEKILISHKNNKDKAKERLALNYLLKYLKDLQLHFNLSDESIKQIIIKASATIKSKNPINKILDMLKSFW